MASDSANWNRRVPCFALIRGPFGRAGYQVATVAREGDLDHKIILLFSRREEAERYAARHPMGFEDWKPGALPTPERLASFLESMEATARHVCLDFDGEPGGEIAVPVEVVLGEIESTRGGD